LRGLSALESGLTTVPQALGLLTVVPLAGWLYPRFGARALIVVGLAASTLTAAAMGFAGLETDLWWVRGVLYGRGLAFGLALVPLQTAAFDRVSSGDTGRASAMFNTARHVAASLGVALLASVLAMGPRSAALHEVHAGLLGFQAAFGAAAVLGIAGTVSALRIPDGAERKAVSKAVEAIAA
jgi:MFS family permease